MRKTGALQTYLDFALDAVHHAGRVTLQYFKTSLAVERKTDLTPVTVADRQAEETLRTLIGRRFPHHGIIGEEYGELGGKTALRWIIDPIDGTRSFLRGVPLFATLLSLVEGDTPLVGVIHLPALGETVYASWGGGCFMNGRPVSVSTVDRLDEAVLLATDLETFARQGKETAWHRLVQKTALQRTWGNAYGHALVATGRADVMLDPIMSVWDCGPLQVVIEEAGGRFTDWKDTPTIWGGDAISTNGRLHDAVMDVVGRS